MPTAYEQAVEKARKGISALTLKQQKELSDIYTRSTLELASKIRTQNAPITDKMLLGELNSRKMDLYDDIKNKVSDGVKRAAEIGTEPDMALAKEIFKSFGDPDQITSTMGMIQENVVRDIIRGDLYADNKTLSDRIWRDLDYNGKDIQQIVATGLQQQKSAKEIAMDLEWYAKAPPKRPTKFAQDYTMYALKTQQYNALRLARTSINHAYQTATIQSSQVNPYVDGIKWKSAMQHGRTCKLCIERATEDQYGLGAGIFPKDKVPLDHPNGLCTMIPEIEKDLDDIAEELNQWVNGAPNPKLDKWYKKDGWMFGGVKPGKAPNGSLEALLKQKDTLQQEVDALGDITLSQPINKVQVQAKDYQLYRNKINNIRRTLKDTLSQASLDPTEIARLRGLIDELDNFELTYKEYFRKKGLLDSLEAQIAALGGAPPAPKPKFAYIPGRKVTSQEIKDIFDGDISKKNWGTKNKALLESAKQEAGGKVGEDLMMKKLYKDLGFDGKPIGLTAKEYAEYKKNTGYKEIYRGVGSTLDRGKEHIKNFVDGEYYAGKGIYGNGTYTALRKNTAVMYASNYQDNVMSLLIEDQAKAIEIGRVSDLFKAEHGGRFRVFRNFGDPVPDDHIFADEFKALIAKGERTGWDIANNNMREVRAAFQEEGKLALISGYDAIYVKSNEYYVILNRTATKYNETVINKRIGK